MSPKPKKGQKREKPTMNVLPVPPAARLIPLVLVFAAVIVYSNSFAGPFIFDDFASTTNNPHIRHLWPLTEAMTGVPQSPTAGRPIVALSLTLNYAFGGFEVWGYHAVNLAIHVLAALTLFGLLRRSPGEVDRAHNVWIAGYVALIWELHPLSTETVVYIVQRTELLVGLFLLLTLYCLARGASSARPGRWYALAIGASALGMGSKEVMAGAPLLAFVYDAVFLSGSWREAWRRRWPVHVGIAATWVILAAEILVGSRSSTVGFEFTGLDPWSYLKTQCGVILHYLRLAFWPAPLSIDYADWPIATEPVWTMPSVFVVLALVGLTVWALWRKPRAGFAGACFFVVLAPSSSIVPIATEVVAERRMYLPLAAVLALVVVGAYRLVGAGRTARAGLALASVVAIAFGVVSYRRNLDYRSELAIWTDAVAKRPGNHRAHYNLGLTLANLGRDEEAISHFQTLIKMRPNHTDGLNNLGVMLMRKGRNDEAIRYLQQVLILSPHDINAQYNLGIALQNIGRLAEAEQAYRALLKTTPSHLGARNNLGSTLFALNRIQEAVEQWKEALRIDPNQAEARRNLDAVQRIPNQPSAR